ncbi:hypothetical protein LTR36_006775 [Oleoguttula mirabilis]|uniref:Uncharacterized protein n=1 Tax=Oleoguttula mirabilis TaxID=1507867 RepID=A0AAV9JC65_9PEZI|nr:hypothetical protein LTR36_006775 [Oleoguttula mirabilis]
MASFSYFLDKLSPETRVLIYGFVFGECKYVTRRPATVMEENTQRLDDRIRYFGLPTPKRTGDVAINSDIFAVDKQVSVEALETFYNARTVRVRFERLYAEKDSDYLNFVRRLEFADCLATVRDEDIHLALRTASRLPGIKLVTILSDSLADSPVLPPSITVRAFVDSHRLGELTCADIGQYRLSTAYGDITIVNSKLSGMWPDVASTPANYDAKAKAVQLLEEWQHPDNPEFSAWCDLFAWAHSIKATDSVDTVPLGRDGRLVPIHKLGPKHDAVTLEWATELLAMNIETYVATDPSRLLGPEIDAKVCWPELENGECAGAEAGRQNAEEHARNVEWRRRNIVQNPVDDTMEFFISGLKSSLSQDKRLVRAYDVKEDDLNVANEASNEDVKKIFHLIVATGQYDLYSGGGAGYQDKRQELDEWSHVLLCKYIRSFSTTDVDASAWSLDELRNFFGVLIHILEQRIVDVQAMPGAFPAGPAFEHDRSVMGAAPNEDEELYQPFVKKLRRMWRLLIALPWVIDILRVPASEQEDDERAAGEGSNVSNDQAVGAEEEEGDWEGWGRGGCVVC